MVVGRPGGIETRQHEPPGPTPREKEERGEDCCTAQRERVRAYTATAPRNGLRHGEAVNSLIVVDGGLRDGVLETRLAHNA